MFPVHLAASVEVALAWRVGGVEAFVVFVATAGEAAADRPQAATQWPQGAMGLQAAGAAVDVTLLDRNGDELDMGTSFDEMSEKSHPEHETRFIANGALRSEHLANRHLLRESMKGSGFHGIATEWWHFDFGDRTRVRREFARVE